MVIACLHVKTEQNSPSYSAGDPCRSVAVVVVFLQNFFQGCTGGGVWEVGPGPPGSARLGRFECHTRLDSATSGNLRLIADTL